MKYAIDLMQPKDWAQVRAIYAEGLATGLATFMVRPPQWKTWDAGHLHIGRLVARDSDAVIGWAALTPVAET